MPESEAMNRRSPNEASRDFTVGGCRVLKLSERLERESQMGQPSTEQYIPEWGCYDGKELQRDPGIPASRFRAFELPSYAHGLLHYPDGRKLPFPAPSFSPPAR